MKINYEKLTKQLTEYFINNIELYEDEEKHWQLSANFEGFVVVYEDGEISYSHPTYSHYGDCVNICSYEAVYDWFYDTDENYQITEYDCKCLAEQFIDNLERELFNERHNEAYIEFVEEHLPKI